MTLLCSYWQLIVECLHLVSYTVFLLLEFHFVVHNCILFFFSVGQSPVWLITNSGIYGDECLCLRHGCILKNYVNREFILKKSRELLSFPIPLESILYLWCNPTNPVIKSRYVCCLLLLCIAMCRIAVDLGTPTVCRNSFTHYLRN